MPKPIPKLISKVTIESLEPLIEELIKDKPNTMKIKKMMMDQGLPFTSDPIQQMSVVLTAMSSVAPQIRRKKSTEQVEL